MTLVRNKYVINETQIELSLMKIIFWFIIEFLIAITLYCLLSRIWNYIYIYIKSLFATFVKLPRDLTGDVVMIIGATSTLGTSLAEEFAKRKCSIVCIDKDKNLVQQLALDLQSRYTSKGGQSLTNSRVIAYHCDILNSDEIKDVVNKFKNDVGSINILIICIDTCQDIFDTAMTIWMSYYSAILTFLSSILNRERVHIVAVRPVSSEDASVYSGIAIANLMECLAEKLSDYLHNYRFLTISPMIERRSIKQREQQVARDIVEDIRKDQSSLIYSWNSYLLHRDRFVARLDKVLQFLLLLFKRIYY